MAFQILKYKSELGRYTRGVAFGFGVALAYYGSSTFHDFLSWDWARADLGYTIPVLEVAVEPGLLAAAGLFVAVLIGLRIAVNHPTIAEFLIDTEAELKRVTWPSWPETWNGSLVVVLTVVVMLFLLAGADLVLSQFFEGFVF